MIFLLRFGMPRGDIMEAGMNEMDLEGKGQSEGKKEKKLVVLIFPSVLP